MKPILIYTTFDNINTAQKTVSKILEQKLVACANIFQSHLAMYVWDGEVKEEQEFAVNLCDTTKNFLT